MITEKAITVQNNETRDEYSNEINIS